MHTQWRQSIKRFLGLPRNTPNKIFDKLFENSQATAAKQIANTEQKIQSRFESEQSRQPDNNAAANLEGEIAREKHSLTHFPKNFKALMAYAQYTCSCHNQHLTAERIFEHFDYDNTLDQWIAELMEETPRERDKTKKRQTAS